MNSSDFKLEKSNWENTCEEVQEYMEYMEARVEELEEEAAESERAVNRLGDSNNRMCDQISDYNDALKVVLSWVDSKGATAQEYAKAIEELRVLTK